MMALLCDTGLVTPGGSVQITYSQTVREKRVVTGLCIECAVRHPGFREILGGGTGDGLFLETPLPEAWVDARRYRLLQPIGDQETTCSACKRRVPVLYVPAG